MVFIWALRECLSRAVSIDARAEAETAIKISYFRSKVYVIFFQVERKKICELFVCLFDVLFSTCAKNAINTYSIFIVFLSFTDDDDRRFFFSPLRPALISRDRD